MTQRAARNGVACRLDDLGPGGQAMEFDGFVGEVSAYRVSEVVDALREANAATRAGLFAPGFVSYDAAAAFDPALAVRDRPACDPLSAMPMAWFGLFRSLLPAAPICRSPVVTPAWRWEIAQDDHARALGQIRDRTEAGWTYQVNYTTLLTAPGGIDPQSLYARLGPAQGGRYNLLIETPDWAVACVSPELFFSLDDGVVTARPMKGTAARGCSRNDDRALAQGLAGSEKERAENVMIVDLVRNDLGRIAEIGSVSVPELFTVEAYPTVWQMTSTITARVPPTVGVEAIFAALFPSGSVTGAPKVATMKLIAAIEARPRGVYCGAVGYLAPRQHHPQARFAVAIRTAVVTGSHSEFGVGSGITWDSTATGEWQEWHAKATILGAACRTGRQTR